ncbi:hydroxyacylglutathione hydrolase [Woeseia oceani]|uniref:hydroxyacylglutathione hydrolase n=1 Tax=Woeseia oceani TaxID=1548547 RepID=A0A193LHD0_9GAMM|nr:hydroxyacylglutathione hydrolase [Woeseia oceani]ANO51779.1 hydroxyacylglutathione hydrolase [Woeseia oceani]
MIIEQIWTANSLRNFNYLVACPATGDALAIDPLDFRQCLAVASDKGWRITQIVNTHEHADHIGGNKALAAATGAKIIAHHAAKDRITDMARGVGAGDRITVGTSIELECLDTPGHTMSHICLLSRTGPPALFSGDTLFNAGVGNCHNGGHPEELYKTFDEQLCRLPGDTVIYPGHDYLVNNLRFTLDREPDNADAQALLDECANHDPQNARTTTIGDEHRINTFFRLQSPTVISRLLEKFPQMSPTPEKKEVFLRLRELRNSW